MNSPNPHQSTAPLQRWQKEFIEFAIHMPRLPKIINICNSFRPSLNTYLSVCRIAGNMAVFKNFL